MTKIAYLVSQFMGISHVAPRPAGTDDLAGVRGKARFTHYMTFFRHDVRRKRFSTHRESRTDTDS